MLFEILKFFKSLVLPSSLLGFLLFLDFFLFFKKKWHWLKKTLILSLIFYLFFFFPFLPDFLISLLEKKYSFLENPPKVKYIVLLTGKEESWQRVYEAERIYFLLNQKPFIIVSGSFSQRENQAELIKKTLEKGGVKEEKILTEDKSKNTYESAKNLKKILKNKKFILVTSAFHMPRAIFLFKKEKLHPIPAPCDFQTGKKQNFLDFFPSAENLEKIDLFFYEILSWIYWKIFL